MSDSILLIDDDADLLRAVGDYFEKLGYEVYRAATGSDGVATYARERPDVVLLDLFLPDGEGLVFLEGLRRQDAAVIMLTGHGDVNTAVRAMQLGAENFLAKPVDMTHLAAAVARVGDKVRLTRRHALLRAQQDRAGDLGEVLGVSPAMRDIGRQVEMLAQSDRTSVLLTGESGTGKGYVARRIHNLSARRQQAFVDVNCAGLSATFLDSELFGHEKGAFTDARERKMGLLEVADRGTVFLDEIGELALELQPKLLKVLESKSFRRLGGTRELTVDVRLITATNRNLDQAVASGAFREDLYYRLAVMPLHLPPLRERAKEDRLALIQRFFADLATGFPDAPPEMTTEALDRLLAYQWPGNIRELRNVIERSLIMARGAKKLGPEHLPGDLARRLPDPSRGHPVPLAEIEKRHIERTLRRHGGNRTRAAEELGISRATLINKIKVFALDI
jgi:two-component system response regulator HydG